MGTYALLIKAEDAVAFSENTVEGSLARALEKGCERTLLRFFVDEFYDLGADIDDCHNVGGEYY